MAASVQLVPALEPIRPHMEQVACLLDARLAGVREPLRSALCRSLGAGKQLRPALVILVGQLLGAAPTPLTALAAAVDMLHTATLIHDDLVDGAALRRGRETIHTRWSVGAAVLAGDYMLAEATSLIAQLAHPSVFAVFSDLLCRMCSGEITNLFLSAGERYSPESYYRGIEAKTALLFAAAAEMAALLAGADAPQATALRCFGREFGMAYQIVDDVLDLIGDEARLGKPVGSDLRRGVITLPVLVYLEGAPEDDPVRGALSAGADEGHVRAAIAALRASAAVEVALAQACAHVEQGKAALAGVPDNAYRQMLCAVAEFVVTRSS